MIEQLAAARDVLRSALDQYLSVCLFIDKSYVDGCLPASTFVGLMNGISDELSHAPIYEEALLRARLACASVRNRSSQIVPLNRLPADILIQIFQLVTIKQNCLKIDKNSEKKHKNPKYPSLLTQVCSRWRQVAMAAGDLWTHIDLPWYISDEGIALARVEERIARSGSWPVEVHIIEPRIGHHQAGTSHGAIAGLLASLSPRTQSLNLNLTKPSYRSLVRTRRRAHASIFDTCFVNSRVGTLTRLVISLENMSGRSGGNNYFIEASETPRVSPNNSTTPIGVVVSIAMSEQGLENLLLPVTSLELKGYYFRWASKAYHGLVELRLGVGASISETELLGVLSSSSRLRLLDFGLPITHNSLTDHDVTPVLLADLETLITGKSTLVELGAFLRLIRPGSRPLSIILDKRLHGNSLGHHGQVLPVVRFFSLANLYTICMAGSCTYFQVTGLVRMAPRARVLVLNRLNLGKSNPSQDRAMKRTTAISHLDDLYVLDTRISLELLLRLMKTHFVRRLIITEGSRVTLGDAPLSKEQLHAAVSCLGCTFKSITSDESYPMKQWS